jgi:hypothetical protein
MSRLDCRRVLLATKLAFASETLGWSRDWSADTGFADRDTIAVLRIIQEKIADVVYGSDDRVPDGSAPVAAGLEPDLHGRRRRVLDPILPAVRLPARHALQRTRKSPSPSRRPQSTSARSSPHAATRSSPPGPHAVNSLTLLALVRVLEPDTSLVALDWQHQTYRFWPHRLTCQPDQQWQTEVFPNGDYYIFLTEDMSTGTFGRPWEQTLCIFGEPLVSPWSRCSQAGFRSNAPPDSTAESPARDWHIPGTAASRASARARSADVRMAALEHTLGCWLV